MRISNREILRLVIALTFFQGTGALADEVHSSIDWHKLQLTPQQSQQIQLLDGQWNQEYMEVQPSIIEDSRKLTRLLSDPKSDPLEILALQQAVARKKEQLRSTATTIYLKKRQCLSDDQQKSLEDMVRQTVAERQRMMNPGSQTDVMPDRIQILMQRVRNIWPH